MARNLIYGVGVNDVKTPTTRHEFINGKYKIVWKLRLDEALNKETIDL